MSGVPGTTPCTHVRPRAAQGAWGALRALSRAHRPCKPPLSRTGALFLLAWLRRNSVLFGHNTTRPKILFGKTAFGRGAWGNGTEPVADAPSVAYACLGRSEGPKAARFSGDTCTVGLGAIAPPPGCFRACKPSERERFVCGGSSAICSVRCRRRSTKRKGQSEERITVRPPGRCGPG